MLKLPNCEGCDCYATFNGIVTGWDGQREFPYGERWGSCTYRGARFPVRASWVCPLHRNSNPMRRLREIFLPWVELAWRKRAAEKFLDQAGRICDGVMVLRSGLKSAQAGLLFAWEQGVLDSERGLVRIGQKLWGLDQLLEHPLVSDLYTRTGVLRPQQELRVKTCTARSKKILSESGPSGDDTG